LSVEIRHLPALRDAIVKAEIEAKASGLLPS
jgi:hypothetical protein